MRESHDIEIVLDEDKPVDQQRVLKATVEVDWTYERNPCNKEVAHYHGEDDGAYIEDWTLIGEAEIDGVSFPSLDRDSYDKLEKAVENLSPYED